MAGPSCWMVEQSSLIDPCTRAQACHGETGGRPGLAHHPTAYNLQWPTSLDWIYFGKFSNAAPGGAACFAYSL